MPRRPLINDPADYCRFADATLPNPARYVRPTTISRKAAEYFARQRYEAKGECWEEQYVVFPEGPKAYALAPLGREIPF
jgi:hypothetical protein